jgi:hypothetical protein
MADNQDGDVTLDELRVLARLAGLPLEEGELETLLPVYQFLRSQVAMLHESDLPVGGPATTFPADWNR